MTPLRSVLLLMHRLANAADLAASTIDVGVLGRARVSLRALHRVGVIGHRGRRTVARASVVRLARSARTAGNTVTPPPTIAPQIVTAQRVSVHALRLSRLASPRTIATEQVDARRYRFHVSRVAARPVPAEMINLKTIRDGTNEQPISGGVRFDSDSVERGVAVSCSLVAVAWVRPAVVRSVGARGKVTFQNGLSAHGPIYNHAPPNPIYA